MVWMAAKGKGNPRRIRAFRISDEDWAEITRRAKLRRMTATEYVTKCALGTLEAAQPADRLDALEERVGRLETAAGYGAFG